MSQLLRYCSMLRRVLGLLTVIVVLVLVLLLVVLGKTFSLRSRQLAAIGTLPLLSVPDSAVLRLAGAVRIPTVSYENRSRVNTAQLDSLYRYLQLSFPQVHTTLQHERIAGYSLMYHWKGKEAQLPPLLLLAHQDVVPADSATLGAWQYPPFSGALAQGYLWGRGTLDDKVGVLGILEAVELLLAQGYQPRRSVYLAFGHDEEIGGSGANAMAALLASRGVKPALVQDEGGAITQGLVPGMAGPVALVGTAEKGYLTIRLRVQGPGGHSSTPGQDDALPVLLAGLARLSEQPFTARISPPVQGFIDYVGPELPLGLRAVFANSRLLRQVLLSEYQKSKGGAALVRTTCSPTLLQAGIKDNSVPALATATLNLRLLPGDSSALVVQRLQALLADDRIQLEVDKRSLVEASASSPSETEAFKLVQRTLARTAPTAVVAPYLMLGAADARHYTSLARNVYRFLPVPVTDADLDRIHGLNERIAPADYKACVQYYGALIQGSDGAALEP